MKQEIKMDFNVYDSTKPIVFTVLEGKALDPINPVDVLIHANIFAVEEYLNQKEKFAEYAKIKETAVIAFNTEENQIVLRENPSLQASSTICAILEKNSKITEFGINTEKRFSHEELKKLVKLHPHLFVSKESHLNFLSQLTKFKAKVEHEIDSFNNDRGTVNNTKNAKVLDLDIVESFTMKCPIFKGGSTVTFEVNVCFEPNGNSVKFYLESAELIYTFQETIDKEFERQKTNFVDRGYVCVTI